MSKKKTKIIFAGSNKFSLQHLKSLFFSKYKISALLTAKNKKKISPIKKFALQNNIPILQPKNLKKKNFCNQIKDIHADILIICAYGMLIPSSIINLFSKKAINIHASLLPRWRGAAPIQWAILSGDKKTGISIIQMSSVIDAGPILGTVSCPILFNDTTKTIYKKLTPISIHAMHNILIKIIHKNQIKLHKQDERKVTYAPKIKKEDAKISWTKSAKDCERLIRALNPWPRCYFILQNKNIKIIRASVLINNNQNQYKIGEIICANKLGIQICTTCHILNIEEIQIEGCISMHISQILNSKKNWFTPGTILM
ncbi:methionyl-tRNA formyltransferase [Buchnera aphidicola]|uniref:methionyl-tRNA formyltransferase n=1 Tax=Buchnera aphidicola TaxID=9 RepID=UPI00094CD2F3|nr:methionyl-tRNA formyltransferase [Buchnera aphidicola]